MHKFMQTGAALAVIMLLSLSVSGAQEDAEEGALEVNDEGEIVMNGVMEDVPLSELLQLYSDATGRTVLFDRSRMGHHHVTFTAPTNNATFTAEEVLHSALSEHRLAFVSDGVFDRIVAATEAVSMAESVAISELGDVSAMKFVKIVYPLKHADANAARGALQNVASRQGGVVNPVPGINALIICDYAQNLRTMVKLLDVMEAENRIVTEVVTLQNTEFGNIYGALQGTQLGRPQHLRGDPYVGATDDGKRVTVTGKQGDVERVVNVIKELDQPQE